MSAGLCRRWRQKTPMRSWRRGMAKRACKPPHLYRFQCRSERSREFIGVGERILKMDLRLPISDFGWHGLRIHGVSRRVFAGCLGVLAGRGGGLYNSVFQGSIFLLPVVDV